MIKKIVIFVLFYALSFQTIFAAPIAKHLLEVSEELFSKEAEIPNPLFLKPQWWKYYDVEGKELTVRIQKSVEAFQAMLVTLSAEEQEVALSRINSIIANLNALAAAKSRKEKENPLNESFFKSYTLENQLELNRRIRKLILDKKTEEEELALQKKKIAKTFQYVDNLMVKYLAYDKASSKKFLAGLDIMARRSALALGEQSLAGDEIRVNFLQTKLNQLNKELDASVELLDLHQFDSIQMGKDVQKAQQEYERAQQELAVAEANSLGFLGDSAYDRSMRYLMEQKNALANVNSSLAWSKLSLYLLKFNLLMDVNGLFSEGHERLLEEIETWKARVDQITQQITQIRHTALKEQDRGRQEYALLIHDNADPKLIKINQSRKQESLNTLTQLQILEESLFDVQWMIDLLEKHIGKQSSSSDIAWRKFGGITSKSWDTIVDWANFSLFKLSGIPITFYNLLKLVFITLITFYISRLIRSTLNGTIKRRGNISDATIYTLGRMIHYCVLIVGTCFAFISIGFDFGNLFILASALTFGLGFGLQSAANNIICGIRILMERKLKIGDYVELHNGCKGRITEIQLQHTVIYTNDGSEVIVPNSELIDKMLMNWTMSHDYKRLHISFSVDSSCDKELIRRIVAEAAYKVTCTVPQSMIKQRKLHEPQVWLVKFEENRLDFELVVWVSMAMKAFSASREADYVWEIETALRANQIPLPMLHRKVYFESQKNDSQATPILDKLHPQQFQIKTHHVQNE